jgi:phosphoribosyl-ATP pyrophosphohydrolase
VKGVFTDGRFTLLRDADAVEDMVRGWLDIAFLGEDFTAEYGGTFEVFDTIRPKKESVCRFELMCSEYRADEVQSKLKGNEQITVATSYPKALSTFATKNSLNVHLEVVCTGSAESYATRGIVDAVFDLVSSGKTKEANQLVCCIEGPDNYIQVVTGVYPAARQELTIRSIEELDAIIASRLNEPTDSYTSSLLKNLNNVCKKLGEEAVELAIAASKGNREAVLWEAADLLYVMRCALVLNDSSVIELLKEDIKRSKVVYNGGRNES